MLSALGRLLVIVERYPDLKSNQNFLARQDKLAGTENRIAVERRPGAGLQYGIAPVARESDRFLLGQQSVSRLPGAPGEERSAASEVLASTGNKSAKGRVFSHQVEAGSCGMVCPSWKRQPCSSIRWP